MATYDALGYRFTLDDDADQTVHQLFEGLRVQEVADDALMHAPAALPRSHDVGSLLALIGERAATMAAGNLLVSGGCVSRADGGSLLICGRHHSGRTILTARTAVRGFAYSADGLVCLDPETTRITPYRPPLRIRRALQHIAPEWQPRDGTAGVVGGGDWLVPAGVFLSLPSEQTLFPDLIAFPELALGGETITTTLSPSETAFRVGQAAVALERLEDPAQALARLARRALGIHVLIGSVDTAVSEVVEIWGGRD